jgi:hypothetical protein
MKNDTKELINKIQSEWDLISKPLVEAQAEYLDKIRNLILKYSSTSENFEEHYQRAWNCTVNDFSYNLSARDLVDKKDVMETMLRDYIHSLEYDDN